MLPLVQVLEPVLEVLVLSMKVWVDWLQGVAALEAPAQDWLPQLVLLEGVLREGSSWELKGSRTGVSAYVQMQPSDRECCGCAYKSTLLEAFTAALMQALRLEVKRA